MCQDELATVCVVFNRATSSRSFSHGGIHGESVYIKSSVTCDSNLHWPEKQEWIFSVQTEFSSIAHLALSLKFFRSSDKLLKVIH